uniref:Uncharacterized protein n=1 Tax=Solanum tuberosum TaxID=4113 RepID=M1E1B2_SOLTU
MTPTTAPLTVRRWDHGPSSGSWLLASVYWFKEVTIHEPYHDPCEGPQIMKATLVLHLGLGLLAQVHGCNNGPSSRLRTVKGSGLMPEPGWFLPFLYEPSHGSCGVPRLVKRSVVHHFWVGVNHDMGYGPWS